MASASTPESAAASRSQQRADRLRRRAVTIPAVLGGTLVGALLSPVILPLAFGLDIVRGRRRLPAVRSWLFTLQYLANESVQIALAGPLWVLAGFGRTIDGERSRRRYERLQHWSVRVLGNRATQLLGLQLPDVSTLQSVLAPGPVIVLARHVAMLDSSIPLILAQRLGLHPRVVMMAELLNDPGFDLIYQHAGSRFVVRDNDPTSTRHAAEVGQSLDAGSIAVIFPEGRLFRPSALQGALARIGERDHHRAERLRSLRHVLPPRPGGVLALLDAAPAADVVVIAHAGLDASPRLIDLLSVAPLEPIALRAHRIPRADVPSERDEQIAWLDGVWLEMDSWIHEQRTVREAAR